MALYEQLSSQAISIPPLLEDLFAPAQFCLYEWQDYWLELPEAVHLLIGQTLLDPIGKTNVFRLRFENQLGLARICPVDPDGRPTELPLMVEVISKKTAPSGSQSDLQTHAQFFDNLLSDLFVQAARLPFTITAPTGRGAVEALRPPTPLFTYHFLCQHKDTLRQAIAVILVDPYQLLSERSERLPIFQAREAGPDILLEILYNSSGWVPTQAFPLALRLKNGHAPQHVWQRLPEETFDSPENRFVLAFLQQLLTAAEGLPAQRWWTNAPSERKAVVIELSSLLRQIIHHPMFAEIGPLTRLPFNSQVLLRREGYRELLALWGLFQQARRPLFERLQHAIVLRDIATLYEIWVFFNLVNEIANILDEQPVLEVKLSDDLGLDWSSAAVFGERHRLIYNQSFTSHFTNFHSYSLSLRPDFVWLQDRKTVAVFDAKFRLEWQLIGDEPAATAQAFSLQEDLYKMHTYRDALDVPIVISLYPGNQPVFYDTYLGRLKNLGIADVLLGSLSGIGAIPMSPPLIDND